MARMRSSIGANADPVLRTLPAAGDLLSAYALLDCKSPLGIVSLVTIDRRMSAGRTYRLENLDACIAISDCGSGKEDPTA